MEDRRKHQRFELHDSCIINHSEVVGTIVDISMGGMSCTCLDQNHCHQGFLQQVDIYCRKEGLWAEEINVRVLASEAIPGMFAEVNLQLDQRKGALSVPVSALSSSEGHAWVLRVAEGRIERRPVSAGIQTPTRIEILSGLRPSDMVVIGNRSELQPGAAVTPKLTELAAVKGSE